MGWGGSVGNHIRNIVRYGKRELRDVLYHKNVFKLFAGFQQIDKVFAAGMDHHNIHTELMRKKMYLSRESSRIVRVRVDPI